MSLTQEYLKERINVLTTGCWEWIGAKNKEGGGVLRIGGKQESARRVFWQMFVGEIPEGYAVSAKNLPRCIGPSCCNPAHLRLKSRSILEWKVCDAGHRLLPSNMQVDKLPDGSTTVRCKTCRLDYWRKRMAGKRAAAKAAKNTP